MSVNSRDAYRIAILFYGFLFIGFGCMQRTEKESDEHTVFSKKYAWLIGDWENKTDSGLFHESWEMTNDSMLSGTGLEVLRGDTVFMEELALLERNNEIQYVATVNGQNDNQPVWFRLKEESDNGFTAVNTLHDYPQVIRYSCTGTVLTITLEGLINKQIIEEHFIMRKSTVRLMPS